MEVLITEKIGKQGFELISEQLGAILLLELSNQKKIQCKTFNLDVFNERQNPIASSEDVVVNVSLNNIAISSHTEREFDSVLNFFVDVYVNGDQSIDLSGDAETSQKLNLLIGWVRYILSSTRYKTLAFDYGMIMGTYVRNIQFDDNFGEQNGTFSRMARISFEVRAVDGQDMENGSLLGRNNSIIKLEETELGYQYNFVN